METWITITLSVIGGLVLVIGILAIARHLEKVRREALEKFASELSLDFHPFGHDELNAQIQGFKLFNSGHSRKMTNVIIGETDLVKVAILDDSDESRGLGTFRIANVTATSNRLYTMDLFGGRGT